jgi:hypothetical protein
MKNKMRLCQRWFDDFDELSDWLLDYSEEGAVALSIQKTDQGWILFYYEPYDNPID